MIWKILFIFCALVLAYLQLGGLANFMTLAEVNILLGYILSAIVVFILGYFYSLGWNKRLFSLKANNIIFSFIVLYIIFSMVMAVISGITPIVFEIKQQTAGTVADSSIYLSTIMLLGLSAFVLYSLLYSPVIIAFFKYKNRFENLQPVNKPYWKMFLTFLSGYNITSIIYVLLMADFLTINLWDILLIISMVYEIFIMIGFAYNIKFGPQILWKISSVPFVLLSCAEFFLCSDQVKDLLYFNLILNSYVSLGATVIITVLILYVLYSYAFKTSVYQKAA